MFGNGYILAFAVLIAAGIVGAVVLPAAPLWDTEEGATMGPWFRAEAGA